MKKLFRTIILRKSYLLIVLVVNLFIMNMVVWNEVSFINEYFSNTISLRNIKDEDRYVLKYTPNVNEDRQVIDYSLEEKQFIYEFLYEALINKYNGEYSESHHQYNSPGEIILSNLKIVDEEYLKKIIFLQHIETLVMDNIFVTAISQEQVKLFEKQANRLGFNAKLVSLNELYQREFGYLISASLFLIVLVLVFVGFSLIVIYLIVFQSMKKYKNKFIHFLEEGQELNTVERGFNIIIISFVLVTLVYSLWYQSTFSRTQVLYDFLYLFLLNLVIILMSSKYINRIVVKQLK